MPSIGKSGSSKIPTKNNFRIDGIAVYLGKKEPIIKHYKGIQFD